MRFKKMLVPVYIIIIAFSCEGDVGSLAEGTNGQGGSMTRFAINGSYMYVVDNSTIQVFDISQSSFSAINSVSVGFGVETVFASAGYLYLGANDAMYIYDIADRRNPNFVFRYSHIRSCDPVVVQGNRAYVTLRSGNLCNAGSNALEIIDITDPYAPTLIANHPMNSPHGLGIDNTMLFICEGETGLKVFNVADENNLALIAHHQDFFAYDVIAKDGVATITGEDGIFQFSYGNGNEISLISKIPVLRSEL